MANSVSIARWLNGGVSLVNSTRQSTPDMPTALEILCGSTVQDTTSFEACRVWNSRDDEMDNHEIAGTVRDDRMSNEAEMGDGHIALRENITSIENRLNTLRQTLAPAPGIQAQKFFVWKALLDVLDKDVTAWLTKENIELKHGVNILKDEFLHANYNADKKYSDLQAKYQDLKTSMQFQTETVKHREEQLTKECTDWQIRYDNASKNHKDEKMMILRQAEISQTNAKLDIDDMKRKLKSEKARRRDAERDKFELEQKMIRDRRSAQNETMTAGLANTESTKQEAIYRAINAESQVVLAEDAKREAINCANRADSHRRVAEEAQQEAMSCANIAEIRRQSAEVAKQEAICRVNQAESRIKLARESEHRAMDYANMAESQRQLAEKARREAMGRADHAETQGQAANQRRLTADKQKEAAEQAQALAESNKVFAEAAKDREIAAKKIAENIAESEIQVRVILEAQLTSLQESHREVLNDNDNFQTVNKDLVSKLGELKQAGKKETLRRRKMKINRKVCKNKAKHYELQLKSCQTLLKDAEMNMAEESERLESVIQSRDIDIKTLTRDLLRNTVDSRFMLDQVSLLEGNLQEQGHSLKTREDTIFKLCHQAELNKVAYDNLFNEKRGLTRRIHSLENRIDEQMQDLAILSLHKKTKLGDLEQYGISMPLLQPQVKALERMIFLQEYELLSRGPGSNLNILAFVVGLESGQLDICKLITFWKWMESHHSAIGKQSQIRDAQLSANLQLTTSKIHRYLTNLDPSTIMNPIMATAYLERVISLNLVDDVSQHWMRDDHSSISIACKVGKTAYPVLLHLYTEANRILMVIVDESGTAFPCLSDRIKLSTFLLNLRVHILNSDDPMMVFKVDHEHISLAMNWFTNQRISTRVLPESVHSIIHDWP